MSVEYKVMSFEKAQQEGLAAPNRYASWEEYIEDSYYWDEDKCSWGLWIIEDGVSVFMHSDGGEPEDNTFYRDWCWVAPALNEAYNLGLRDGTWFGGKWNG